MKRTSEICGGDIYTFVFYSAPTIVKRETATGVASLPLHLALPCTPLSLTNYNFARILGCGHRPN